MGVYLLLTLDRAHRTELLVLDGLAVLAAAAALLLPLEAMSRRRLVTPFFLAWSITLIGIVVVAVTLDDDRSSPLLAIFFLPMLFAAMAYPLRLVVVVALANIVASTLTLWLAQDRGFADVFLFTV